MSIKLLHVESELTDMKINATDYDSKSILRILREWSGLTQKEFGKMINKSERTIQNYEGGVASYTVNQLLEIARAHNIEIVIQKKEK